MSSTATARKSAMAVMMAFLVVASAAVVMLGNESNAAIEGDYGEIYEVDLAPAFSWTYTPTFPSDLDVTVNIQEYEEEGITASIQDGTLHVSVNEEVSSGSYDLILLAETDTAGIHQELPMHIRFNIVPGISVSGSINNLILGASVDFTPNASSGMTETIEWSVSGELPAGLEWDGSKITGTPTQVGTNSLSLIANAAGEQKQLDISFIVYNVIVNGTQQTIYSHGNSVSTIPISQTISGNEGDLTVTWAVTSGNLPDGFDINPSTGVISGSSSVLQETTVTVTGTSSNMTGIEQQTASFQVTIQSEPTVEITSGTDDNTFVTYPESEDQTVQFGSTEGTSDITWTVTEHPGVSITPEGLLTITDEATAGNITVTATSEYGGTDSFEITITNEATIQITGENSLATIAGTPKDQIYSANVEGAIWSVNTDDVPMGASVSIDDETGVLTLSGSSPVNEFTVTITVTTPAGQSTTLTVTCQIVSQLVFTNTPENGAAAIEM